MSEHLFKRNKYCERLRLTAADLENQQAYDSGKRRLLNRALYGRGVIFGLTVQCDAARGGVLLEQGLALDAQGRELFVPVQAFFPVGALFLQRPLVADGWHLCIRYEERDCGEGHVLEQDGTHSTVPNRTEEGYRLLAVRNPCADEICLARLVVSVGDCRPLTICAIQPLREYATHLLGRAETSCGALRIADETVRQDGEVCFSDETSHGLGAGNVQITLAVDGREQERRCVVSGTEDLFYAGLQTAVELFPGSGTFVAAVRVRGGLHGALTIRWYAQRLEAAKSGWVPPAPHTPEKKGPPEAPEQLHLEPHVALLSPGEKIRFFACAQDGLPRSINMRFTVLSGGGVIDSTGLYTAPQAEGTHKIRAVFEDRPENILEASAIVLERV